MQADFEAGASLFQVTALAKMIDDPLRQSQLAIDDGRSREPIFNSSIVIDTCDADAPRIDNPDRCRGKPIDCCGKNGAAVLFSIRRNVGTSAAKADPQRRTRSKRR